MPFVDFPVPNVTNAVGVLQYANSVTGDGFGIIILLLTWIVIFIAMNINYGSKDSFLTASFITTILSLLLRIGSVIGDIPITIFIILTALGFTIILLSKNA